MGVHHFTANKSFEGETYLVLVTQMMYLHMVNCNW